MHSVLKAEPIYLEMAEEACDESRWCIVIIPPQWLHVMCTKDYIVPTKDYIVESETARAGYSGEAMLHLGA